MDMSVPTRPRTETVVRATPSMRKTIIVQQRGDQTDPRGELGSVTISGTYCYLV